MFRRFKRSTDPSVLPRAISIDDGARPDGIIVLANRAPFRHERDSDGSIRVARSASGLVTALEPLMEMYSGVWVALGAGTADGLAVDSRSGVNVPPANPRYRLRYAWLDDAELQGYYYGFANEGLWPLCHQADITPVFRPHDFAMYEAANQRFAAAVADEAAGKNPVVLIQDYHFARAPRFVRRRMPASPIVAFWHIPWPRPRVLRTCPWASELLDGLLASDIVGLQTDEDRLNFLACVESVLDAQVDRTLHTVRYRGRVSSVRVYPVGVEPYNEVLRSIPSVPVCRSAVRRQLGLPAEVLLGVGIDRLDYT
jgi:trehalose 6-phosphate synthase